MTLKKKGQRSHFCMSFKAHYERYNVYIVTELQIPLYMGGHNYVQVILVSFNF